VTSQYVGRRMALIGAEAFRQRPAGEPRKAADGDRELDDGGDAGEPGA